MLLKSDLVNFLFLIGFAVFGYGNYIGQVDGLSEGLIVSSMAFMAIILFYLIDTLYRKRVGYELTGTYWLGLTYIVTLIVSLIVALRGGIPGVNPGNLLLSSVLVLSSFNAAVIVLFYNRGDPDFDFAKLFLKALGVLLLVNVLGFALGMHGEGHNIEGRVNLPFFRGIYHGAHILSVFCLMLVFYLRDPLRDPVRYFILLSIMLGGVVLMLGINSRLSFLVFALLLVIIVTKAARVIKGLYTLSLFTLPLLLSFALLVYQILSLPVFVAILKRVDKEDVTTFNGRSYLWASVGEWAWNDRTGLLFGNGFKGHYKLGLLELVAKMWDQPHAYNMHTHSTFTEVAVAQGVFGVLLLYVLFWRGFKFFRSNYIEDTKLAPMFGGFLYLLFIWQIDIVCYHTDIGHAVLFAMLAPLAIKGPWTSTKRPMVG
ncbi:MAG: O-antigen ligase family protein [Flavobacteriales bacterium]|nr:O-antigen ligase family protein [Flavobacteriales bacterium]